MHAEEYASQEALQIVGAIKDRAAIEYRRPSFSGWHRWTPEDHADGRKIDELSRSRTVADYRALLTTPPITGVLRTRAGEVRLSPDGNVLQVGKLKISIELLKELQEHGRHGAMVRRTPYTFEVLGSPDDPMPIITKAQFKDDGAR